MAINNPIFELCSYTYIDVTGKDTDKFLQGQISINVESPNISTAILAALCSPKGRIVSLFHITKIDSGYRLFLPKSILENTLAHLKKYAVFFKVTIKSAELLNKLYAFSNQEMKKLEGQPSEHWTYDCINILDTSLSFVNPVDNNNQLVADNLSSANFNDNDWYWQLAKSRIPWLNKESVEQFLPHNLNLPKLGAVDFNKGCFTGQEIIARMQYKGKLKQQMQLLKSQSPLLITPREPLLQNDKKIGEVICGINVRGKGCLVLALLKNTFLKNENIQLNNENASILKLAE